MSDVNTAALLAFRDVDVHYGQIQALKKVNLHINPGETVSLILSLIHI